MTMVLEWRSTSTNRSIRSVVSYVRVFRSVPALKAFLRSRRFALVHAPELRLSVRDRNCSGSVFTTVGDILLWDPAQARLPAALVGSHWEHELAALGLPERVLAAITTELERAWAGNLLTSEQVASIRQTVAAALGSDPGDVHVAAPTREAIMRVAEPRFERPELARAWFEREALPGFSGATAQQLVDAGRGQEVLDYIAAVDAGIHV